MLDLLSLGVDPEKAELEIPFMKLNVLGQTLQFTNVRMNLKGEILSFGEAEWV